MIKFESGYFDRDNRKYMITNMTPTRPLVNHIWSEEFMMTPDHFGCGNMICDGQEVIGDTLPVYPAGTEHFVTVYTNIREVLNQ